MQDTFDVNQLIETHSDKAFAAAYRLTGNDAEACDLLQETFVRVLEKIRLYDPAYDFGAWFHSILYRLFLNRRRDEARRKEVPLETPSGAEDSGELDYPADYADTPDAIMEKNETNDRISELIRSLAPDMRACLILVDVEGYNYSDAAKVLNWPVGSVAGRLFRARRLIRTELTREGIKI